MIGEVMFTGEYKHTIDPKNRMFLPSSMREELGDEVYIVKGVDTCIAVYSKEAWEIFTEKLNSLPEMKARRVKRTLMASAVKTKIDGQGRVLISQSHKAYADLDKNVYVIGVGNHIEIWDEERWQTENDINSEELAETLMSLGF